jgi:hypothetical protein
MSTKNPRVNVTFGETTVSLLMQLASTEHKSVAGLVRELALEALEMREDFYLSRLADKLDTKGSKTYKHDEAWQ